MFTPWWPLAVLAVVSAGDAVMCVKPLAFIRACLRDVHFPQRYWKLLPPIKLAAAAGLVIGIWLPPLAVLTAGALVLYFLIAVTMHVRAGDFGRNLFLNASGMLLTCIAVLAFTIAVFP
ncbi:DoxX family protein [Pseudonocardia eucalypti]|uniref:DoxX family protein n=1 Tax=Pseudonocardia eucalypti TaxID=648755 RepID=A0ABP9QQC5_9PSEU|nr:hypothetical protein [Pseudonocardia eucalypti]